MEDIERLSQRLSEGEGALRAIHLRRHLDTMAILTPHQVEQYQVLRGYADGDGHGGHGHG